jgi:hypothetical protein
MDAANIDLKAFTEDFCHRFCAAHLAPVLSTLEYVRHKTNVWLEVTTLFITGRNDGDDEIDALTRWIAEHLGTNAPTHRRTTAFHRVPSRLQDARRPAHSGIVVDPRRADRAGQRPALRVQATCTTPREAPPAHRAGRPWWYEIGLPSGTTG